MAKETARYQRLSYFFKMSLCSKTKRRLHDNKLHESNKTTKKNKPNLLNMLWMNLDGL